ncbi:hypothetical protein ABZW03_40665, partial [Kitasatospora sp. NPDC004799]
DGWREAGNSQSLLSMYEHDRLVPLVDTFGLTAGLPWPERLRRAVALSAATVLAPQAGRFDAEAHRRLLGLVRIEELDRTQTQPADRTHPQGESCR